MGRIVSATNSTQQKKPWDGIYTERPIWGIFTMSAGGANAWVYAYGASNRAMSVGHDRLDSTNFNNRQASNLTGSGSEVATSYYPTGNASTQVSSQAFSPTSGYFGINTNSQTALLNYSYAFQNGNIGYMNTNSQTFVQRYAVTQVLREFEQQDYDIVCNPSNYRIQTTQVEATQQDLDWSYTFGRTDNGLMDITGHTSAAPIASYNRRTNTLAFLYHYADAVTNTKKLHVFKMPVTFSPNQFTTGASIAQAMADAKAAGGYSSYMISLPSWHNSTSGAGRNGGKLVFCDDDSFWFVSEPYANGSSGSMFVYSVVKTNGTYTATQVKSLANTTHYNSDNDNQYSLHHQTSDDNKYVAIYTHYYYYLGGYMLAIVGTATAALVNGVYDFAWYLESNSQSYTIAPSGGSEFVVSMSYNNQDGGAGPYLAFHNPTQKNTSTYNVLRRQIPTGIYPSYSTSTNYQGFFVFKYQPVNQYK